MAHPHQYAMPYPVVGHPYYQPYSQPVAAVGNPATSLNPPSMAYEPPTATRGPVDYPNVISWCQYLDAHNGRNRDGVIFEPFGALLKTHGFVRITQLTSGLIGWKDLKECLGIEMGMAILILQYAKEDVQAITEGKLFIPSRS